MNLEPVGTVKSPVTKETDEGWGKVTSEIRLNDAYAEGLTGLDGFSHAIIVFYMHKASFDASRHLVRRPQGKSDMPEVGIFAQRAKHRPNPIGVTAVEIVKVEGSILTVRGLDAVDSTPVLDVKPYFAAFDRVSAPRTPDWVDVIMERYF